MADIVSKQLSAPRIPRLCSAYCSDRSNARPRVALNSLASSVPSLSRSTALKRFATNARYVMRGARRTLGVAPVKKVAATSGFLTPSPLAGACLFKMMDVGRHKSVDTLRGYVRDTAGFRDHAGAGLL